MKPNKHTRKNRCPECNVQSGSYHNKICPWAWVKQTDHKTRQKTHWKQKLSATMHIWRAK